VPQISATPVLTVEAGKPFDLRCETQATQVVPDAKVSAGAFRVRVTAPAVSGEAGSWMPIDRDTRHEGSLSARHAEGCKAGCPAYVTAGEGASIKSVELWAPRRTTMEKVEVTEPLTVAVIDATTWKLKASTFLDRGIASLEQGTCSKAP
jgi:hypothetical protein